MHECLLIDQFTVRFGRSVLEAVILEEIDQCRLRFVGRDVGQVVVVSLCEPKHLLKKQLAKFDTSLFGPHFERADFQDFRRLDCSISIRRRFVLADNEPGGPIVEHGPAGPAFAHAFITPPCVERWVVLAQAVKDFIRQLYFIGADLLHVADRCLNWLVCRLEQLDRVRDEQNTAPKLGGSAASARVQTAVFSYQKVGRAAFNGIKQGAINHIVGAREGTEFALQLCLLKPTHFPEQLKLFKLAQ